MANKNQLKNSPLKIIEEENKKNIKLRQNEIDSIKHECKKVRTIIFNSPLTYIFILATGYGEKAFMGLMWPQRFLGFSIGIVMYAILTYFFLNQGMTPKTWVSLTLAVMIIIIQVIFK